VTKKINGKNICAKETLRYTFYVDNLNELLQSVELSELIVNKYNNDRKKTIGTPAVIDIYVFSGYAYQNTLQALYRYCYSTLDTVYSKEDKYTEQVSLNDSQPFSGKKIKNQIINAFRNVL
jgi:hypothetical protein